MKKFYIPYIVFCIIIITLFVLNLSFEQKFDTVNHEKEIAKKTQKTNNIKKDEKNSTNNYTVKAEKDDIFLFDKDNKILRKLNIDFTTLREYDKKQFIQGIEFSNMQDVYQLVEDFSN